MKNKTEFWLLNVKRESWNKKGKDESIVLIGLGGLKILLNTTQEQEQTAGPERGIKMVGTPVPTL